MGDLIQFRWTKSKDIPEVPRNGYIQIPGIPYRWGTNLSDPEVVDLYHFLLDNGYFPPEPAPGTPDPDQSDGKSPIQSHQLKTENKKLVLPDGRLLFFVHSADFVIALVGTRAQWATLAKRKAEKELKENLDQMRSEQLNDHVEQLIQWATENISKRKFRAAEAILKQALKFKWKHQPIVTEDVERELFNLYHRTRDVSAGLALLEEIRASIPEGHHSNVSQWVAFGHKFETSRHYWLAEQVYRTTIARFPRASEAYKRLVLTLEYAGRYEEAIEVCRSAIVRGIEDYTQTGYAGRMRRIQRKLDRQSKLNEKPTIDQSI